MSNDDTIRLRIGPGGDVLRVMPDGAEEPYRVAEPDPALDAMTDEEITQAALADPDNPPLTDEQLDRAHLGRRLRRLRERLGLSQPAFAERYRIPLATLRDWEQGRRMPNSVILAYFTVIEREPDMVAGALAAE